MSPKPRSKSALAAAEQSLREAMLRYPEATEDFPWGHRAGKVKGKMFVILVLDDTGLSVTTKLPRSNEAALMMPFCTPTGYGMAKSGWVSSHFKPGEDVPVALLTRWMDESFRAVAPKKLVERLDAGKAPAAKKAASKRPRPPRPPAEVEG